MHFCVKLISTVKYIQIAEICTSASSLFLSQQLELFIVIIIKVYRHKNMKFRKEKLNFVVYSTYFNGIKEGEDVVTYCKETMAGGREAVSDWEGSQDARTVLYNLLLFSYMGAVIKILN